MMDTHVSAKALDEDGTAVGRFILRFFLVVVAVVLGAIVALFVGLATGWIGFDWVC